MQRAALGRTAGSATSFAPGLDVICGVCCVNLPLFVFRGVCASRVKLDAFQLTAMELQSLQSQLKSAIQNHQVRPDVSRVDPNLINLVFAEEDKI